jgi:hypothetical protein
MDHSVIDRGLWAFLAAWVVSSLVCAWTHCNDIRI